MKITIKLNRSELRDLVDLLESCLQPEESTDRLEAIIVTLMVKLYVRLKQKSIMPKPVERIELEPETAMAFVEYFNGYPIACYNQANTVNKMIFILDTKTASFFYPHKNFYHERLYRPRMDTQYHRKLQ